MQRLAKRLFSVDRMLPRTGAQGPIPTTKEAYSEVTRIALPSVLEMVLMSLIGAIDTMMVSALGTDAIAAVGLVGQPRMLFLAIIFAINIGVTSIVARRKGEGRQADANMTLRNAVIMITGVSVVLGGVSLLVSDPLMRFAGAEEGRTLAESKVYFEILMYFLPINALTMSICAAQRGVGNTKITMYVNVTSNVVNVIFNYLLINGKFGFPKMGVAGAALATGIGFCVGFVLCILTVLDTKRNMGFLRFSRHDNWRLNKETVQSIVKVGGSAMFEQVCMRIGFFSYAKIVAGLGTDAFAAHQICMQFLNISFTFGDGIGVAGTSLVGQMLGKKRPDLSQMYGKIAQRMAVVVAFTLATLIVLFRYPLVSLFAEPGHVMDLAAKVMLMVALFQPLQMSSVVISGALRGAGDTLYVAVIMMICVTIIRPLLALAAIYGIQHYLNMPDVALIGAWAASLVDMTVRMTLMIRRFNGGKWHGIKV